MPVMIQIRNVEDKLHAKLKLRAAERQLSLSDYLKQELSTVAERPTWEEFERRIASRSHVTPRTSAAKLIRRERDALDRR